MIINRGDILVEVLAPDGQFENVDILDLDEESFRRWLVGVLIDQCQPTRLWSGWDKDQEPLRCPDKVWEERGDGEGSGT